MGSRVRVDKTQGMCVVDILVEGLFGPSSLWCVLDTEPARRPAE